ncbi:MAG: hypothetical protein D6785_01510, partial [Planctomycetota bacterium]
MKPIHTFRPVKKVFVYYYFLLSSVILLFIGTLISGILFYLGYSLLGLAVVGLTLLRIVYQYVNRLVSYQKTHYEIFEDRLVQEGGGLFYNKRAEVLFKNITHLGQKFIFPEYQLFQTTTIYAKAAGTDYQEIDFSCLKEGDKIESIIREGLQKQGFSLKMNIPNRKLRQNIKGIFLDLFQSFFGHFFFAFIIWVGIVKDGKSNLGFHFHTVFWTIAGGIIFFLLFYQFFLNLSARYEIYEDAVTEEVHFLTYKKTIMPMENLADVHLKQNIIKSALEIYDITISCQGRGQEVHLRNIEDGENIRALVGTFIQNTRKAKNQKMDSKEDPAERAKEALAVLDGRKLPKKPARRQERSFETDLYMDEKRVYFSAIVYAVLGVLWFAGFMILSMLFHSKGLAYVSYFGFIFVVIAIVVGIYGYIQIGATKYSVCSQSFVYHYRFFVTKMLEFTTEKTTALVVYQGIIDRILGTCTIRFNSIGTIETMYFRHIRKDDQLIQKMLAKEGCYLEKKIGSIESKPTLVGFFIDQPVWIALFPLGVLAYCFYYHYYYRKMKLHFYDEFVHFQKGWISLWNYYVRYEDIKGIGATEYPFLGSFGKLTMDYAGVHLEPQGKHQVPVSNSFTISLVSHPFLWRRVLDLFFTGSISAKELWSTHQKFLENSLPEKKVYESRPNYLQYTLAFWLLVPFALGIMIFSLYWLEAPGWLYFPALLLIGILLSLIGLYVHFDTKAVYFYLTPE